MKTNSVSPLGSQVNTAVIASVGSLNDDFLHVHQYLHLFVSARLARHHQRCSSDRILLLHVNSTQKKKINFL